MAQSASALKEDDEEVFFGSDSNLNVLLHLCNIDLKHLANPLVWVSVLAKRNIRSIVL